MRKLSRLNLLSFVGFSIMGLLALGSGSPSPRRVDESKSNGLTTNNSVESPASPRNIATNVGNTIPSQTKPTTENECPGEVIAKLAIKRVLSGLIDQTVGFDDFEVSAIMPTKRRGTCRTTATYNIELRNGAVVQKRVNFTLIREQPNVAVPGGLWGWRAIAN